MHKYLMKGQEYEGATFFSLMPSDRRHDNVNKLKYRESHLNIRKENWGLQKEAVESPYVEIFKTS